MRRLHVLDAITLLLLVSWLRAATAEPLGTLHCNDSTGVSNAAGRSVTISGIVTAQFSTDRIARIYVQDATGGICVYGPPKNCVAIGDSVRVTGKVESFGGLTEITGSSGAPLKIAPLGKSSVPLVALGLTPTDARATQQADGCEPNESRLVLVRDVLVRGVDGSMPAPGSRFTSDTNYRLAHAAADSATDWVVMRVGSNSACDSSRTLVGQPVPIMPVQVTGVLSQYLGRSATKGGYQILPRMRDDVQPGLGDYRERQPNR
jgi:DNA/RNA endonuclease YhcR with UshA esterase domain